MGKKAVLIFVVTILSACQLSSPDQPLPVEPTEKAEKEQDIVAAIPKPPPPKPTPEAEDSPYARMLEMSVKESVAELIGTLCVTDGLRYLPGETQRITALLDKMHADGFSREEIKSSISQLDIDATEKGTFDYFRDNNIDLNDTSALCAFGQQEVTDKTPVGRLLIRS